MAWKSLEDLVNNMKQTGTPQADINRLVKLMSEIGMIAKDVAEDYKENPSEASGGVDTEKGLVSGSGVQIHSNVVPDNDSDDWELMPEKKKKKK
tara:strand:- start:33 stop:314 length:282 start_codon:yes stop_codon:yes gene_type:complete